MIINLDIMFVHFIDINVWNRSIYPAWFLSPISRIISNNEFRTTFGNTKFYLKLDDMDNYTKNNMGIFVDNKYPLYKESNYSINKLGDEFVSWFRINPSDIRNINLNKLLD